MVILPDHLHAVWTFSPEARDYPTGWMLIKAEISRRVTAGEQRRVSRVSKRERGVWQRRYWEHLIRAEQDYARHVDHVHWNPVKHGYVTRSCDWRYSSIHRYVAARVVG